MEGEKIERISRDAVDLAAEWQDLANGLMVNEERQFHRQMAGLLKHPKDKMILSRLLDQSFRTSNAHRIADQLVDLFRTHGEPDFLSARQKKLVWLFLKAGRYIPQISVPLVIRQIRRFSRLTVIPGEEAPLVRHLRKRTRQNVRMNINHLGEAVLGEAEAERRLNQYLSDLAKPEIETMSVKISTIYSQIQPLAFDYTVQILEERLTKLYRAANRNRFKRPDGNLVPKFVNLDMEEYKDLEITTAVFISTLSRQEFQSVSAGIALQAYLPDSFEIQKRLTDWAVNRLKAGGAPIKIRVVKGANLEMEQVEASIRNWPLAPYSNKRDVDANYKRMLIYGLEPAHAKAVRLGVASHNLFEQAFAYRLAEENQVIDRVDFEMLEGMADHIRRAISKTVGQVLLYAPVSKKDQFINAIAYLMRRLDENTAPDNFLRYANRLEPGSDDWNLLKNRFLESCRQIDKAGLSPHRVQNRSAEELPKISGPFWTGRFDNEPDTDWSLAGNRAWAEEIRTSWKKGSADDPVPIPLVIGGEEITRDREKTQCLDASQNRKQITVATVCRGTESDAVRAVEIAREDPDGWRSKSPRDRQQVLAGVANELRAARGDLIGAAAADTGKVFTEADVEVSEAIDFAEFYPFAVSSFSTLKNLEIRGKGVGVVISPWNFPIAIPAGGIISSLAAGNTVIFKPASDAVLVAWELCQAFWRAGISRNTLQFLPGAGSEVGQALITHPDASFVILTGGTETGMRMLSTNPRLFLAAETGGKNATIITAMSDRDQAIKNVVYSAFGNCGQKCSATSLLILEKAVYQDEHFKTQLIDAAKSFPTGSAWDFRNKMGPLIKPPANDLLNALTRLEAGETWALKPENIDGNPYLWTPGIKWDVTAGSYTHLTEFFGPVLAVMCADDLEHAIQLVNETGYGLTSGLESLDPREQAIWKEKTEAGNLCINRGTTGAVTLRQPFGGFKKSSLGAGIKAGSPNYVTQFMSFHETGFPESGIINGDYALLNLVNDWQRRLSWKQLHPWQTDLEKTVFAVKSYLFHMEREFSRDNDYFHLRGQDNVLRYRPVGTIVIRGHSADSLFDVLARIAASTITGNQSIISFPKDIPPAIVEFLATPDGKRFLGDMEVLFQDDEALIQLIGTVDRIRYAAPERIPDAVLTAAAQSGFYVSGSNVLMQGRIELMQYLKNQSICHTYHRYGNLGERERLFRV